MQQMESQLRESILEQTLQHRENARENVRRILSGFLVTYDSYPLLKHMRDSDLRYLMRKLPAERLQAHVNGDKRLPADSL